MGTQLNTEAQEPAIRFCINAFATTDGHQEYAAPDTDDAKLGWNVYARTPDNDTPVGVDLSGEGDYPTYAAAREAAERGCATLGLDPADIRLY
jgi:hypothetical protein